MNGLKFFGGLGGLEAMFGFLMHFEGSTRARQGTCGFRSTLAGTLHVKIEGLRGFYCKSLNKCQYYSLLGLLIISILGDNPKPETYKNLFRTLERALRLSNKPYSNFSVHYNITCIMILPPLKNGQSHDPANGRKRGGPTRHSLPQQERR